MSCIETYSTLRIFSELLSPSKISEQLSISGTKIRAIDPSSKYKHRREQNLWAWSTKDQLNSKTSEEHISYILNAIKGKSTEIEILKEKCQIDIVSFYVTSGQGGPSLSSSIMTQLGMYGIDVWWDIYFDEDSTA